jgi:hypothetical protein
VRSERASLVLDFIVEDLARDPLLCLRGPRSRDPLYLAHYRLICEFDDSVLGSAVPASGAPVAHYAVIAYHLLFRYYNLDARALRSHCCILTRRVQRGPAGLVS